jgi:hypothetical protein
MGKWIEKQKGELDSSLSVETIPDMSISEVSL